MNYSPLVEIFPIIFHPQSYSRFLHSLSVGLISVSCYFSSTWSMMCSSIHLYPISVGSFFPRLSDRRFSAKGSEKWALMGYSADCPVFVLFAFKVQFLRPRWPIKFDFGGRKVNTFWPLPARLTMEGKEVNGKCFWSQHTLRNTYYTFRMKKPKTYVVKDTAVLNQLQLIKWRWVRPLQSLHSLHRGKASFIVSLIL